VSIASPQPRHNALQSRQGDQGALAAGIWAAKWDTRPRPSVLQEASFGVAIRVPRCFSSGSVVVAISGTAAEGVAVIMARPVGADIGHGSSGVS
jgi:hypothetical protein